MYDLIIVGAGPTGIACGIEAVKAGLNYVILEKGFLVNSIYHFPTNMQFFSTSMNLEIGKIPFISHQDKPTRKEALEYYRRIVQTYNLNINYNCKVDKVIPDQSIKLVQTNKGNYKAKYVVVATGFYDHARPLNVLGEDLPKVQHYYDDAHKYIGQKLAIVGGANSACDVALETWQKGADVTMVVRSKQLYQKVKYWILPNVENRIKEGSIKAFFSSSIKAIYDKEIEIETPNGLIKMENDFVLAMTGYRPDYHFLKKLGIELNGEYCEPSFNQKTLESNVAHIYLAGVILSGEKTSTLFIENTRSHGEIIVGDIICKMNK